jgi:hypothetical protein
VIKYEKNLIKSPTSVQSLSLGYRRRIEVIRQDPER